MCVKTFLIRHFITNYIFREILCEAGSSKKWRIEQTSYGKNEILNLKFKSRWLHASRLKLFNRQFSLVSDISLATWSPCHSSSSRIPRPNIWRSSAMTTDSITKAKHLLSRDLIEFFTIVNKRWMPSDGRDFHQAKAKLSRREHFRKVFTLKR